MSDWLERNQAALGAELARVAARVAAHADGREPPAGGDREPPPLLERLVEAFGLSPFERDVLLLCAGGELQARFLADAGVDERPTFGLALGCLAEPHWSALAPAAPLRRGRLIELDPGDTVATRPLRIAERVLHHLTGVDYLDERLHGTMRQLPVPTGLPSSHQAVADRIVASYRSADDLAPPAVALGGREADARQAVAAAACAQLGLPLQLAHAAELPATVAERTALARLWEREAALGAGGLLVELGDAPEPEALKVAVAFAEEIGGVLFLSAQEPPFLRTRTAVRMETARPSRDERRDQWQRALGARAAELNGSLDGLLAEFDLGPRAIAAAATQAGAEPAGGLAGALRDACRGQARPRLDDLAQRIDPVTAWDDLVLPREQRQTLRDIAAQVRQRARVYDDWGFAGKSARGLGISALFEGPSGTGKTTGAEVLAIELELDLYRIDLSQVVSKYIGETEKNLRRVFDAAELGGAILLFDEADALFGKRSEVRDSHDRYANIEVSYLLQRMEAYRGLAILTTNRKDALDPAFMRRIRFVVRFPFPSEAERAEIWRRMFPAATPTEGLAPDALARLSVAGGNIRNIALDAAFLAADAGEPVRMGHLVRAAARECVKLERPLTKEETRGWT